MTIINITPREQVLQDTITRLQGEAGVLRGLLRECAKTLYNMEPATVDEFDDLCDLADKCEKAADDGVAQ